MSIYSRKRTKRNSQSYLGHLKLSIHEDSSALVVTVYEARGLKRKEGSAYDTYVKLYMLPDPWKQTKEKTKRLKEKDPVFNAKFTFLLNDEGDYNKSLFISVWNRERTGRTDMIGCMTFNVSDLTCSSGINGWYQLLGEEKGRKENIAVPSSISKGNSVSSLVSTISEPSTPISRNFAVTLVRSPKGYGFKVTVGTPVYISEVSEGLPANQLDIQVGDMIIEVDGTDVMRANGEMVANMIKKHKDTLQMILMRTEATASPTSTSVTSFPCTSHSLTDLSYGRKFSSYSLSQTTRLSSPEGRFPQPGLLTQPADFSDYHLEDPSSLSVTQFGRERIAKSKERLPEVPEEYTSGVVNGRTSYHHHLNTNNGMSRSISQTSQKSGNGNFEMVNPPLSFGPLSFSQPGGLDFVSNRSRPEVRKHSLGSPIDENRGGLYDLALTSMMRTRKYSANQARSFQKSKISSSSVGSVGDSAYSTANSSRSLNQLQQDDPSLSPSIFDLQREKSPPMDTAIQKISPTSPIFNDYSRQTSSSAEETYSFVDWESLNKLEQKRQRFLNSLIKCEKEFCDELKRGVETFLCPMSGVISENSHRTIFMSLDSMYELSKYFYTQITHRMVQCMRAPANVPYYVEEFASFYHNKLHLLVKLFEAYLRNSDSARKEIAVCFTNDDFKRIVKEPSVLYSFVEMGTEYLPKMCRLLSGISYVTPLDHSDHNYLTDIINTLIELLPASCNDLRRNWKSENDIMENLRSAITFTSSQQAFDIVKPGRVLLHEGEAHLTEKRKKRKVWLLLFSDMLLITKRSRHVLCVTEAPFHLNTVIVQDINCEEDEIQISTEDGVLSRQFKFISRQERGVWLQKLKERATGTLKKTLPKQQTDEITKKQEVLKTELEQELKTPYRKSKAENEFEIEDPVYTEQRFTTSNVENSLTQVPSGSSPHNNTKDFVFPQSSVVFPMSQPILPSKFMTSPNKKPETRQQNSRKISGMFKRKSADMSTLSQISFGISSPMLSKNRARKKETEKLMMIKLMC